MTAIFAVGKKSLDLKWGTLELWAKGCFMNPIKLRRVTLDLTIEDVARRCGWSTTTQSRIENGQCRLEPFQMGVLQKAIGLDFSNFMTRKD